MIKKIGILTSGGDSPGMNSVIKSIVYKCNKNNIKIYGIYNGYKGLYNNNLILLNNNNVNNIIDKGGTFLGSSRFEKLKEKKIRKKIIKNIKKKIDILIVIGGEGSYYGAYKLNKMNLPCITIPATIDNDILGTDYSIGFYTALETIVNYIDNLKFTLISHKRILILEVMGRKCGNLALNASLCNDNLYLITKKKINKNKLIYYIKKNININKYIIIIIIENLINIKKFANEIENITKIETRSTSLGYIQRGNKPSAFDRILGFKMGNFAFKLIKKNITGKCIGIKKNKIINYSLKKKYI